MLAINVLITALFVVVLISILFAFFLKPLFRRIDKACENIDAANARDAQEKEAEEQMRAQALSEIEEEFPSVKETQD